MAESLCSLMIEFFLGIWNWTRFPIPICALAPALKQPTALICSHVSQGSKLKGWSELSASASK